MKQVKDYMTSNVECCNPNDSLFEVALKMKEESVGAIPVCKDNKLLGMVTDRDLVIRGLAEKQAGSTNISQMMTIEACDINPNTSVEDAALLMADRKIRRLPVTENDVLVGMISLGDIATDPALSEKAEFALSQISV